MIKFEHTEVVGWEAAIRGMRNPMNSWDKTDTGFYAMHHDEFLPGITYNDGYVYPLPVPEFGENDLDLMHRLREAGTDHRKFMRMIEVYECK